MLIQNPTAITTGLCFCWILSSLLVMAGSGQRIVSKTFMQYAAGVILNPVISTNVISNKACAAICQKQLVCSSFSIKKNLTSSHFQCLVSLGEFQWTPDSEAKLFGEYVGDITGYHFGQDGYLYKLFTDVRRDMRYSKDTCFHSEQGTLAVPYPDVKYQALMNTPGVANSNISFYLGAYRNNSNNASDSVWITDDGGFFDTNNKAMDMNQKWGPMQPSNVKYDNFMTGYGNGTWDDTDERTKRHYVCRKSVARYVRSPVNGVYYWASSSRLSQAMAENKCQADGGTLAIIAQIVDVTATEALRARQREYEVGYWVAGTDNVTEGTWVISETTTVYLAERQTDPFQMRFFAAGEPSNSTSENCLLLMSSGAFSYPCSSTRLFLCQITLATTVIKRESWPEDE